MIHNFFLPPRRRQCCIPTFHLSSFLGNVLPPLLRYICTYLRLYSIVLAGIVLRMAE